MASNEQLLLQFIKTEAVDSNESTDSFINLKVQDYVKYICILIKVNLVLLLTLFVNFNSLIIRQFTKSKRQNLLIN
jgi:hypothetical protein